MLCGDGRHVVTRALGTSSADPEVQREPAHRGDVYLLCSDGLSEVLEPAEIAAMLALPAEAACHALVDAAYEAGSRDNISAIVVRALCALAPDAAARFASTDAFRAALDELRRPRDVAGPAELAA